MIASLIFVVLFLAMMGCKYNDSYKLRSWVFYVYLAATLIPIILGIFGIGYDIPAQQCQLAEQKAQSKNPPEHIDVGKCEDIFAFIFVIYVLAVVVLRLYFSYILKTYADLKKLAAYVPLARQIN